MTSNNSKKVFFSKIKFNRILLDTGDESVVEASKTFFVRFLERGRRLPSQNVQRSSGTCTSVMQEDIHKRGLSITKQKKCTHVQNLVTLPSMKVCTMEKKFAKPRKIQKCIGQAVGPKILYLPYRKIRRNVTCARSTMKSSCTRVFSSTSSKEKLRPSKVLWHHYNIPQEF